MNFATTIRKAPLPNPFRTSAVVALVFLVASGTVAAKAASQANYVPTPIGAVRVEYEGQTNQARPAVVILSGSKGLGSPAYGDLAKTFNAAGLDVVLVHFLTPEDIVRINHTGSASLRKQYYAARFSSWIGSVRAVVSYLKSQPRYGGKVGIVGISLGATVAAASSSDSPDIGGVVLVDGGFPDNDSRQVRSMPPLHLIWGSADQVFPVATGYQLKKTVQELGGTASIDVYEGAAHDFFLRSGTLQADAARQSAANFLARCFSQ